ncbi:hypothetical protein HYQ46_007286 [Verticillium longisporum]|nr:hypothetical protein HYQ46_007286 [Verticillium longisporum]
MLRGVWVAGNRDELRIIIISHGDARSPEPNELAIPVPTLAAINPPVWIRRDVVLFAKKSTLAQPIAAFQLPSEPHPSKGINRCNLYIEQGI